MARVGARGRARRTKNYVVAFMLVCLVIAAVWGAGYFFLSSPPPADKVTLCPADGPRGHFVLLVDKTDPLTFVQKKAFSVIVQELIQRRTPEGYLLSVFVLGEDFKATAEPLIELCNPGSGAGKSEITTTIKILQRRYEEKFIGPLTAQIDALSGTESAKASPVFEMLQLVGINSFRKHDVKGERRLIMMSDMLHNTPQFTMFRGIPDYSAFAASEYGRRTQPELKDVQVELHYLMYTPQLQTKRNLQFWEEFFKHAGARVVAVRPLEG